MVATSNLKDAYAILRLRMARPRNAGVLVFDFVINTALTIVEVVCGVLSGSTAVLADSVQNLTDSIILAVAFVCERVVTNSSLKQTKRARAYRLAGSINAAILMVLAVFVGAAALNRILHPQPIQTAIVIIVGLASIVVNWLAAAALSTHRRERTIQAPYIGLIFSGFSGLGVFASGVATRFLHVQRVDGIIGLMIAVVLLWRSANLLQHALRG